MEGQSGTGALVPVGADGKTAESGTTIALYRRVRLNASFAAVMREHNVALDEYAVRWLQLRERHSRNLGGVSAITARATSAFRISRLSVISFSDAMDPSTQMLVESQKIIDQLARDLPAIPCWTLAGR